MKNYKKIAVLLILIGLVLVAYATYLELSPTFGEKEVARYFHHNNTEYIHQIAFIGMCMLIGGLLIFAWKVGATIVFLCITQIGFAQQSNSNLLGYTTKNDTLVILAKKDISESDLKLFNKAKALVKFYKEQEKIENKAGRPFKALTDSGLPVYWRDMPVYVLQREMKDKSSGRAKRVIYDVHVVAREVLKGNTTVFEWTIIQ